MAARPAELDGRLRAVIVAAIATCSRLRGRPNAGSDYVPLDPVDAMRDAGHRVPWIVGTNAEEARKLFRPAS